MSKKVDNRVVQMEFDNKKFEAGVKTTLDSVSKLDATLNKLNDISLKGFDKLGQVVSKVDFGVIGAAADAVSSRMSAMGIVGATVLQNLTNAAINTAKHLGNITIGQIMTGGKNRALNIEAAKFQLEGLGVAWDDIKDDINYGVKDTAYGLDAAAKAASQLVASQVKLGDEMKSSLRGISGVAAMTNSSYEDISNIFTTVAGNGRLYAQQLMQFSSRGLNAAATLGKALNKSEAEIREMVSKGKIDFKTFAKAMDDAFGAHAKDANKTFTGALSNMKAALSRVGAEFYTPGLEHARDIFNSITGAVDRFKATLSEYGIFDKFNAIMTNITNNITKFFNNLSGEGGMKSSAGGALNKVSKALDFINDILSKGLHTDVLEVLGIAFGNVFKVIKAIAAGIKKAFPVNIMHEIIYFVTYLKEKITEFDKRASAYIKIRNTVAGIASVLKIVYKLVKALWDVLGQPVFEKLKEAAGKVLDWTSKTGEEIQKFAENFDPYSKLSTKFADYKQKLDELEAHIKTKLDEINEKFKEHFGYTIPELIEKFKKDLSAIFSGEGSDEVQEGINWFNLLTVAIDGVAAAFGFLVDVVGTAYEVLTGGVSLTELLTQKYNDLTKSVNNFTEAMKNKDYTKPFGDETSENLQSFLQDLIDIWANFKKVAGQAWSYIKPLWDQIAETLKSFNFDDILKAAGVGGTLVLGKWFLDKIQVFFSTWWAVVKPIKGFAKVEEKLTGMLGSISGYFGAMKEKIKAESLKEIAFAILMLAGALFLLSSIDEDKLAKAIASITVLFGELLGMFEVIVPKGDDKGAMGFSMRMASIAGTLLAISIAVGILALSLKALAKMDPDNLSMAFGAITGIFIELGGSIYAMSKTGIKVEKIGGTLIAIAIAVRILASALKAMGSMNIEEIGKGLVGMLGVLVEVGAFIYAMDKFVKYDATEIIKIAAAMVIMAIGLRMMVSSVKALGGMKLEELGKGLGGLAVLLGELFLFIFGIDKLITDGAGKIVAIAAGLIVFAIAINMLVIPLKALSSTDNLIQGLTGLFILLVELFAFMVGMDKLVLNPAGLAGTAASLILLAVALNLLMVPLAAMSNMDNIIQGLTSLVFVLGILAAFGALFGFVPELAAGLLVLSVSILAIGAGIALVGVGIAGLGAGIYLVVAAFKLLVETVLEVGEGLIRVAQLLVEAIVAFLISISEHKTEIIQGIIGLIEIICAAILGSTNVIIDAVLGLVTGLLKGLRKHLPEWGKDLVGLILELFIELMDSLNDHVQEFAYQLYDYFMLVLETLVKLIKSAGFDIAEILFGGSYTRKSGKGKRRMQYEGEEAGSDYIEGVTKSLTSSDASSKIKSATEKVGNNINSGTRASIHSHSPSKDAMEIARDYVLGVVDGFIKYGAQAGEAAYDAGSSINTGFEAGLDTDYEPTITPVMDMSNVNSGLDTLNSMLAQNRSVQLASDVSALDNANHALNVQLQNDKSNGLTDSLSGLRGDIERLGTAMMNTQMVMDTGEVVGVMANPMDRELGRRAIQVKRGGARR